MPKINFSFGSKRSTQNPVATFNGNGHRFFKINMFTGFERGDGMFFMKKIRRADEDCINVGTLEQFMIIISHKCIRAVAFFKFHSRFRNDVRSCHKSHTGFWFVCVRS